MTQRPRTARRQRQAVAARGFTLIEVLLVLIILVVIGSIVVPNLFGAKEKADINAAKAQIAAIKGALRMYHLDVNKYPSNLDELVTKPTGNELAEKWGGPYLEDAIKPDPWSNKYQYMVEGKHNPGKYDIWSNGPDGQSGTDDDIGNWE